MLAVWWQQDTTGKERRERTSLAWIYVFLNIDPVQEKMLKCMSLRFTTLFYPTRLSQALWNRNLLLRCHRSWFDRRSLVNVASHDHESGAFTFTCSRAETLSCQHSNRLAVLHGSFMTLHLFSIMCRESNPPWGKLVWRELSIMSFKGASSHISPDDIWAPLPWPQCSIFPSLCNRLLASSAKFPGFCFPWLCNTISCIKTTNMVQLDVSSHGPNMLHDKSQISHCAVVFDFMFY